MAELKLIAHRGNIAGPNPDNENKIDYLKNSYNIGYDIEVDLIGHRGILYFGHDEPDEVADTNFIQQPGIWCHAKNLQALELLTKMRVHYFWHQKDDITITSQQYFWCYPGQWYRNNRSIWLDFENHKYPKDLSGIYGICSDHLTTYKNHI